MIKKIPLERVSQGDIYRDIDFYERVEEREGTLDVWRIRFPYVLVLTQDCDLDLDFKFRTAIPPKPDHDKHLFSVIVAPMYVAEQVFEGIHLSELGLKMADINKQGSTAKTYLVNNDRPRYHYLDFPADSTLPPMVVDFKHYFSAPVEMLSKVHSERFVGRLESLYREDVCQRFAAFLSRIAV